MSSNIIIKDFPKFKECCDSLEIRSIVDAANNGSHFVFAVNGYFPISFDIETNDISIFQFKSRSQQLKQCDPLCIDISNDSKFVVTGYDDGSIALWSIEHNYTFIKSFQKLHTSPITQIKFGPNNNILASDMNGLTTIISFFSISVSLGVYTFKESIIYQGKLPVQNLIISRSNSPFPIGFIIFPTSYVCFDLKEILSSTFQSTKDIRLIESDTFFDPPCLSLFPRTSDYFLSVCTGKSFKLLQVRSYDQMIPLISDFECDSKSGSICFSEFISNSLIVITTSNGLMELITTNGLEVCSSTSQRLKEMLNAIRSVQCHNEKVILVTTESLYSLSFESWDEMILKFMKEGKFTIAFQSLSEINLDLNRNLVGIPSNLSIRRRKVIELGEKLLDEFFKDVFEPSNVNECSEKVANIAMYTTTLEINDYLASKIASLYEEHGKLREFYEGIQRGTEKNFSLFITTEFLRKFLDFYSKGENKEKKMEEIERMLISLNYQESQVLQVVKVAADFKLLRLIKHLFLKFLNDPITPCQFFYENGKLIEYFEPLFQPKKDKANSLATSDESSDELCCYFEDEESLITTQKSLIVWLMLPDAETGEFTRLRSLFESNWKKASLFTCRIISMLPIQFTFSDTIKVETFVEAVLAMVEGVDYETCEPILDQVLPILAAKEIPLTGKSIKHIFSWCFADPQTTSTAAVNANSAFVSRQSRSSSLKSQQASSLSSSSHLSQPMQIPPSVRESVFEMANAAYPDVVPRRYLISWCERAGFSRFVQRYYTPMREYGRIISSMLLSDESRSQVFEFIETSMKTPTASSASTMSSMRDAEQNKEKMKVAILQNAAPLLLLDPDRFVVLVESHFPGLHDAVIATLNRRQHKLVYLNALVDVVGQQGLTTEWANSVFQLSLDYDPDNACHFLTDHINDVDLDEVERLSEKYGRVDCLVQIKIYNQQFREAIVQAGQEIERKLLNFIESGFFELNPKSIDELCDKTSSSSSFDDEESASVRLLKEPMDMIRVAIRLLQSRSLDKDISLQWQRMYLYFQFPLYHAAQKAKEDEKFMNIQNCVSLMFSFFIVSSLDSITAHHALCILCLHFSVLELSQYNRIYASILSRIVYQRNLIRSLDEMLMIDTAELIQKVHQKRSRGTKSQPFLQCCTCQEILCRSSDLFNIFPCGHCFHLRCCPDTKCPLCAGSFVMQNSVKDDQFSQSQKRKLTTRQVQFLSRRLEFSLRKNFGEEAEGAKSANQVFFACKGGDDDVVQNVTVDASGDDENKKFVMSDMIPPQKEIIIKLDDDDDDDDDLSY